MIEQMGLGKAIEWLAQDLQRRSELGITTEIALREDLPLSTDQAECVFSVVQEALTNVARHARASALCIRLEQDAERLKIAVEDDGVGIPESITEGAGVGMISIRERLAANQGEVRWEASPSGGTRLLAWMQVLRGEKEAA